MLDNEVGSFKWRRVVLLCGLILAVAESLRRSEERFRHLFERMDEAYFLTPY